MSKISRKDALVEELIKCCFTEAYHILKAEKRKTTTRNADIVPNNIPEEEAISELQNKKQHLEEWLNSTFKIKRVMTNELEVSFKEGENDLDNEDITGIVDPYVSVRCEDIKSIEGKTDQRGLPYGRCTVTLHNGDDLFGSWREGRREGLGNTVGPSLEARGIKLIQGYFSQGRLQGPGHVKMVDGTQWDCHFMDSRAQGWVVSSFTRSICDLEADTARESHVVTGPFVARFSRGKMRRGNILNIDDKTVL